MTNVHTRQHALLQVHGRVGHAPPHAARANSAVFARERDQLRVAAVPAQKLQTPVLQNPAAQVLLEFANHEVGQRAHLLGELPEAGPVLRDKLIAHRLLGPTARVAALA